MAEEIETLLIALRETNDRMRDYWHWQGYLHQGIWEVGEPDINNTYNLLQENNDLLQSYNANHLPALSLEA